VSCQLPKPAQARAVEFGQFRSRAAAADEQSLGGPGGHRWRLAGLRGPLILALSIPTVRHAANASGTSPAGAKRSGFSSR